MCRGSISAQCICLRSRVHRWHRWTCGPGCASGADPLPVTEQHADGWKVDARGIRWINENASPALLSAWRGFWKRANTLDGFDESLLCLYFYFTHWKVYFKLKYSVNNCVFFRKYTSLIASHNIYIWMVTSDKCTHTQCIYPFIDYSNPLETSVTSDNRNINAL